MTTSAERLLEMQEQLESKKTEVAQTEGELTQLKQQMNDRHNCSTVKQAVKVLKASKETIEDMEDRFETGVKELEDGYEWD